MSFRKVNGEQRNKLSYSNGTSKLRRLCAVCGEKFVPTGKFSKKCEKCKEKIFRESYLKQKRKRVKKVV